ncbi:uncharacterized protein EHS24_003194 [Apiotrichum porosum]|uniref:Uncharacterized protein n=1 Tax=Apiotrichum porosum TaxID=105984 RepID=A0A427XFZ3_9TREE|nr:uncharacterized protein EHS24_003194 [Apiotrichum porosum]RSH77634.1 hypothetical protein EHS24_003194 [Apiotrichum porosum]
MQPSENITQAPIVAQQPTAKATMNSTAAPTTAGQPESEPLRLRGGCPGKFCGLPILPCRVDICCIPIPCCC